MMPGPVGTQASATISAGRAPHFGAIGNGASSLNNDDFPTLPPGRAANASSRGTWGSNIWGNGLGLGAASREAPVSKESDSFYQSPKDTDEDVKGGLSSLVAASEYDTWGNRPSWNTEANASISQRRRAGGSPSRSMTHNTLSSSQPYNDARGILQSQRSGSLSHTLKAPGHDKLNPTSNNFPISRPTDNTTNGFGFGRYPDPESQEQSSFDQSSGAWTDSVTQRSPAEERRSFGNPDYQVTSSASQSRSGSIPRSRHGLDGMQQTRHDTYPRFSQPPAMQNVLRSQQHATFPRAFPERSGSIQSDAPLLQNLSLEDNSKDAPLFSSHKPSASFHATSSMYDTVPAFDSRRTPNGSIRDLVQGSAQDMSQSQFENGMYNVNGTQTPDGLPFADSASLRNYGFNSRGAITPMSDHFRQSPQYSFGLTPQYSTGTTPPPFDQQYRGGSMRGHQIDQQVLDQRLQRIQQQQLIPRVPPYQSMQSPGFRGQPQYGYSVAPAMMIPATVPIGNVSMLPGGQPPRGPRDPNMNDTFRSQLLEEFKLNSKNSRKYELKDIYDHVVEFSGDQHGSRFIQTKLESANSDEKERVFRELFENSLQLMQDVFGNYVIQKFFEHGDQTQKMQLANKMKGSVLRLATQMYGCRVVQKAIQHVLVDQQAMLVKELENDVLKCVKDQNGNHVIQMAIAQVPAEHIQFIIQAFIGQVASLSSHPYGCRVIQRLLERCEDPARTSILHELHACGNKLIPDQYGNYVVQHMILHGGVEDRLRVFDLIQEQLISFSKHKFASNVVEKALTYATDQNRREAMLNVVKKNERGESPLPGLIKDGYANYVIQKLLDTLPDNDYRQLVDNLRPEMEKARRTASGKNVQAVEKKMHRLDGQHSSEHIPSGPASTKPINSVARMSAQPDSSQSVPATIVPDVHTVATPPPLVTDAQSPPSSSLSSANNSTAGDTVQIANTKPYDGVTEVAIATGV